MCNNCIHKAVCSIYRATGGVKKCEHFKEERRGRWEWYTDRCEDLFLGCDDDYGWRCSKCKVPLDNEDDPEVMPTFRYCPNCGADMRGAEDGN